jgi:hypothetical protein
MATHAFVAYRLTVAPFGHPRELVDLSNIDGRGADLRDLAHGFLKNIRGAAFIDEDNKNYLTVEGTHPSGRTIRFAGRYGRYGQQGDNIIDVDSGRSIHELGDKDAYTTRVRNMIVVPSDSKSGFFLAERYGGRGLASMFLRQFMLAFRQRFESDKYILHSEGLTNGEAWQEFLEEADLARVRVIRYRVPSDIADNVEGRDVYTLSYSATPGRGQKFFPRPVRDGLLNGTTKPQTILGLSPDTEIDETRLEMVGAEWQKDFALEQERTPILIYPLGDDNDPRPADTEVYQQMEEAVAGLCPSLGVDLPSGWQQGAWTRDSLAVPLEAVRGG